MEKILMIGGTGRIARPVVREMVQAGYPVRVLARDPERSRSLLPAAVEWCQGDLQDRDALAHAMRGMDAVYINLPEAANPGAAFVPDIHGMRNILEAAPPGALLMKLSEIGATETPDYANLTLKFRAEEQIRASGHPYIIFRPTWFMESLPLILTRGKSIMYAGAQPSPLYWIAGRDFARQVVAALYNKAQAQNRIFTIQGIEPMTFAEAARRYSQAMGGGLRGVSLPLWVLRLGGLFDAQSHADYELMRFFDRRVEAFESQETWELLGRPETTIEQFVEDWKSGSG